MSTIKTVNGLAWASMKARNGLARASIKTINGADAPAGSTPFGGAVDVTNLVEWWPLNEASGNAIGVHAGLNLMDNNTVTATTGPDGSGARQFTAANDEYFSRVNEAALQTGDINFGVVFWAYWSTTGSPANGGRMISKRQAATNASFDAFFSAGDFAVQIFNSAGSSVGAGSNTFTSNAWHMFAFWHDAAANTLNTKIDAGSVVSVTTGGLAVNGSETATLMIGELNQVSRPWNGRIQRVGFWKNDFPDSTELTALYNSGNGLDY